MKFEITAEKVNPYLKRKELQVGIDHSSESTPSKAALQQLLAKELRKEIGHVDIRDVFSDKGRANAKARVFVWEEAKAQDLSKVVKKKEGAAPAEAPKAETKPAPAAKEPEAKPAAEKK
ncbi:MAG: hypothetical protein HYT72_01230 [Candidatus Aenigmarchaeota archaeon]|nr:hypothetical protein [Candidatus Aenigmarchaeota archaeon]